MTMKTGEKMDEKSKKNGDKGSIDGTSCKICNKKVKSKYYMQFHMRVHTGEKNYVCGICEKGFQQKWNLLTHVARVHSREKPFKCEECGKSFGYSSHFKRHVKRHFLAKIEAPETVKRTILNPFNCSACDRSFESNYRLNLHLKIHKMVNRCKCGECSTISQEPCSATARNLTTENMAPANVSEIETANAEMRNERSEPEMAMASRIPVCEKPRKSRSIRETSTKHLNAQFRNGVWGCHFCREDSLRSSQSDVDERRHLGENRCMCTVTKRPGLHNLRAKSPGLCKSNLSLSSSEDIPALEARKSHPYHRNPVSSRPNTCSEGGKETNGIFQQNNIDRVDKELNASQPKCTGDETLQEFVKIASQWADKILEKTENKNASTNDGSISVNFSNGNDKPDKMEAAVNNEPPLIGGIPKSYVVKKEQHARKIKGSINKLVLNKIIGDLRKTATRRRVKEIVDSIKNEDGDSLKEFLKLMKKVPENLVMKREGEILFWHCWMCNCRFKSRHLLTRHLLIHEPPQNRPYKCDFCSKSFTQSNNFKEHLMSHTQQNQFYCEKCGAGFRHKSHFNVHLRSHESSKTHVQPMREVKIVKGKWQPPNLTTGRGLRHGASRASAAHQCIECLKWFGQRSSLKRHLRTHSQHAGDRIRCDCGETFGQRPSLKRHQLICKNRTDPAVKPFSCSLCIKTFLTKSDLTRHVATHDPCKKYTCSLCSLPLKTLETFKRHLKRHQ